MQIHRFKLLDQSRNEILDENENQIYIDVQVLPFGFEEIGRYNKTTEYAMVIS